MKEPGPVAAAASDITRTRGGSGTDEEGRAKKDFIVRLKDASGAEEEVKRVFGKYSIRIIFLQELL